MPPPRPSRPVGEKEKSVAVLLHDAEPEVQHLADGFVEEVIDCLSMSTGVRVLTLGAVRKYREKDGDPRDFGHALDVDLIASGSLRKVGDDLRITCRLISVNDGFQIWAKKLTCEPKEILHVASDAAGAIAAAITVDHKKDTRLLPTDPAVLDLYLRARQAYHDFSPSSARESVALYSKALELAPDAPVVLAGYAMACRRNIGFSGSDSLDAALKAAEHALALAPQLHEGRIAKAAIDLETGRDASAAEMFTRAVRERTNIPEAYSLRGMLLVECGLIDEGLANIHTAIAMEPRLTGARSSELRVCEWYDLYGGRARVNALLVEMHAQSGFVVSTLEGRVHLWRKDRPSFEAVLAKAQIQNESPVIALFKWVTTGVRDPSFDTRLKSGTYGRRQACFFRQLEAEVAALLDASEQVFHAIESARDVGLTDVEWLDRCPSLDAYRGAPRFRAVRADVAARADKVRVALR